MVDMRMPEPADEFASMRKPVFTKTMATMVNNFINRLRLSSTLAGLQVVRRDIEQSSIVQNFAAKEQLRAVANTRARELGHKDARDWWV